MPIYEFVCEKGKHKFEKILPMADSEKEQECPEHHVNCGRVEYSQSSWVWGYNEIHWSAGTSGNKMGMNHAKRPGK